MSNWDLAVMLATVLIGFSWGGIIFIRPFVNFWFRRLPDRNALIGYTMSALSVFYGLLLGLLSVATYNNSQEVEGDVKTEATYLATLYRNSDSYPGDIRLFLKDQIRNYALYTKEKVWPAQQTGETTKYENFIVSSIQDNLMSFKPASKGEEILHSETLKRFYAFIEARNKRQSGAEASIPPVLWYVVLVGGMLNIALFWLFDMRFSFHMILGGLLAFFLSMMIFVIVALDAPLRGETSVSPDVYVKMISDIN
jgi:hypothetical protein